MKLDMLVDIPVVASSGHLHTLGRIVCGWSDHEWSWFTQLSFRGDTELKVQSSVSLYAWKHLQPTSALCHKLSRVLSCPYCWVFCLL